MNGTVSTTWHASCGDPSSTDPRHMNICCDNWSGMTGAVPLISWQPKWTVGLPDVFPAWQYGEPCCSWAFRADDWWLLPCWQPIIPNRVVKFPSNTDSWTFADWKWVALLEMSCFQAHQLDGHWQIRWETSEKYSITVVGTTQAGSGGSITVWEMLSWHCLGSLVPLESTLSWFCYSSGTPVHADNVSGLWWDLLARQWVQHATLSKSPRHGLRSMTKTSDYFSGIQITQTLIQ